MIVEYSDIEFIKLNRKITNWEWYLNVNVKVLFIHCLLKANWKDGKFEGKEVKRGSFVTSLDKLSKETGLSVRQVRTALNHLFLTGELTSTSCSKYRVITVTNYNQYQLCDKQVDSQATSKRQASDKQATTIEEYIRTKEHKELKKNNKPPISPFEELEKTDISETIKSCLREWLEYKKQKKDKVYPTQIGFNKFIKEVKQAVENHGEEKVIKQFDYAMSRGWSGAYLDKIKTDNGQISFNAEDFLKRYEDGD